MKMSLAVTMIVAGFVTGELGTIPFSFKALNLTEKECRESIKQIPEALRGWGGKPTFTQQSCVRSTFRGK